MKKILGFVIIFFILIGINGRIFAEEKHINLPDPKNHNSVQNELKVGKSYVLLTRDTEEFNGMDFNSFMLDCRGEDYLVQEGIKGNYALTGNGNFVYNEEVGKYSKVVHNGIEKKNYSEIIVNRNYTCNNK